MITLETVKSTLRNYNGKPVKIMEVCGTHTNAILKNGIREIISPDIRLISGPGCPVCVTPPSYIDRLAELSLKPDTVVLSFGDMLKVPGSEMSLNGAKARGGNVKVIYSPLEAINLAKQNPDTTFVMAAVGFETTAPSYALLADSIINKNIRNIKLLTSLKTIIPALDFICRSDKDIDAFLCPGHVSVIIGSKVYEKLNEKYKKPFVISGFEGEHILTSVYEIMNQLEGTPIVKNLYKSVVSDEGNTEAKELINKYFEPYDALWRGIGVINGSGLKLKEEFSNLNAADMKEYDYEIRNCSCSDIILGRLMPEECPLFGSACTPFSPTGPCMVSSEGACGIHYRFRK